ncbi:MAG: metalloregulator ArsR/SmtB family transcription factor [Halopseudomonas sp.]
MNQTAKQIDDSTLSIEQMRENASQAAQFLKAIANENRLMILCHLDGKELSVTELNQHLDLSQSALSQHLAVLRRDGLVSTRRESQTIFYSLRGEGAIKVIHSLHDMFCPEL